MKQKPTESKGEITIQQLPLETSITHFQYQAEIVGKDQQRKARLEQHYITLMVNRPKTILSTKAKYTFFSSAQEIFSRIEHMLGHINLPYKFKILHYYEV